MNIVKYIKCKIREVNRMAETTIAKVMKKKVILADSGQNVMKAANDMLDKDIGSLVVMQDGKPVGIVTETDIVRKVVASGVSSKLITLADIMTKHLVTIDKGKSIYEASRLMKQHSIKRLPVTDGDKVVGIISSTDLIHALSKLGE